MKDIKWTHREKKKLTQIKESMGLIQFQYLIISVLNGKN